MKAHAIAHFHIGPIQGHAARADLPLEMLVFEKSFEPPVAKRHSLRLLGLSLYPL
jgi:hypothetical protein